VKIKIEIELDTERDSQEISDLMEIADRIRENIADDASFDD
jgi:hypothetical protein